VRPDSVREVFRGRLIRVEVETWSAGEREVVRHPGACAVVALTSEGDVLLVRQFREAVRETLLEIPAGIFDIDREDPVACASRELLEETGYRASNIRVLGSIYTSPGFADERIQLFQAEARPEGEVEDGMELVRMPLKEALEAVRDGRIKDAKTVAGLLLVWAARYADRAGPGEKESP
jgi:ADP-ribose pyrophosphatase